MSENNKLLIKKPSEINNKELDLFLQLVLLGKQVEKHNLSKRIIKARILAFYYEKNEVVGIAALKQPNISYKNGVFRKAGVLEKSESYGLEIGWVFVKKEYRKKGIGNKLVYGISQTCQCENVFSTTRQDNLSMQRILTSNGFRETGQPYKGRTGNYLLNLFIHDF